MILERSTRAPLFGFFASGPAGCRSESHFLDDIARNILDTIAKALHRWIYKYLRQACALSDFRRSTTSSLVPTIGDLNSARFQVTLQDTSVCKFSGKFAEEHTAGEYICYLLGH